MKEIQPVMNFIFIVIHYYIENSMIPYNLTAVANWVQKINNNYHEINILLCTKPNSFFSCWVRKLLHYFLFDTPIDPPPVPHTEVTMDNRCIPAVALIAFLFVWQVIILVTAQIEIQLHHSHLCPVIHSPAGIVVWMEGGPWFAITKIACPWHPIGLFPSFFAVCEKSVCVSVILCITVVLTFY